MGLAELLAARGGVAVEIVTPRAMVGEDVARTLDLPFVMPRLEEAGVARSHHTNVDRIENDAVHVRSVWGGRKRVIEGIETVVISMLRSPDNALFRALQGRVETLHRVGDVLAPRRPVQLMYDGEELGRAL